MKNNGAAMSSYPNKTHKLDLRPRSWFTAALFVVALMVVGGALALAAPAQARADACANVGGRHVSVGGCSDVAGTVEQYTNPPAGYPPAPAGNAYACASVGRHIDVSGCV
ncbi:hypothetical protein [Mycobacterium angelicum]|nr:hypothetical protein [Mycobacterium angelicum]